MRLLLVRHGETEGNVSRRLQGADDPLTERGRRQARELAAHLSGRDDVAALYASPYRRAFDTARAIGEALGLEPEPGPRSRSWTWGRPPATASRRGSRSFPRRPERFRTEGVDYSWPGGESGRDLAARTEGEMDRILRAHGGEDGSVVVVSHGGALAWIIAHLLGEPDGEWPYGYARLDNCSITEAEISPNGEGPASSSTPTRSATSRPTRTRRPRRASDPVD